MRNDRQDVRHEGARQATRVALDAVPSRRRVLQLGAVGVPLVLTPKTGLAQTMASVNCSVVLNPGDQNFGLVPTDADYLQNPQILPEMTLTPEQLNTGSFVSDVSDPQYNGAYLRFLSAMVDGTEPLPTASCLTSVLHVQTRQF